MTVCNFYLQGRCRYGEKCWNEHPRGGRGGGGYGEYNRPPPQSNTVRGGGGFGNRVWVNPSQRSSGGEYIAPPSFSRGGSDWGRGGGGGGGGRDSKSSGFNNFTQNRFSALDNQPTFDRGGQDENLQTIQKDMEIWESSGQWLFSCYSVLKGSISGFSELSQEELRLEYYKCRESGDLQTYANSVHQLASQWRSRVQELKTMNPTTRASVISELNNPSPQLQAAGFGSATSDFGFSVGGSDSSSFSFASAGVGFGSASTAADPAGFGTLVSTQPPPLFGSSAGASGSSSATSAASFSFAAPTAGKPQPVGSSAGASGSSLATSAASFSFAAPTAGKPQPPGFESAASGFSFSSSASGSPFSSAPAAGSGSFGGVGSGAGVTASSRSTDQLFTPQDQLTPDELKEFLGKRFTLGQIPLRPPPVDMLVV